MTIEYTQEMKDEILSRTEKAKNYLEELQLEPAAIVSKVNVGNDIFADAVQPYLRDLKYKEPSKEETVKES